MPRLAITVKSVVPLPRMIASAVSVSDVVTFPEPDGAVHAPVESRKCPATPSPFGAKPCLEVETSLVVMSDVERSESLTAANAGIAAPFKN